MTSQPFSYRGYRFPPEIISHAVWLYHRFGLSFRDVEDLLAERGVTVTYEAIRQWCRTFGLDYARRLRRRRGRMGDSWYLDELFLKVQARRPPWRHRPPHRSTRGPRSHRIRPRRDGASSSRAGRVCGISQRPIHPRLRSRVPYCRRRDGWGRGPGCLGIDPTVFEAGRPFQQGSKALSSNVAANQARRR